MNSKLSENDLRDRLDDERLQEKKSNQIKSAEYFIFILFFFSLSLSLSRSLDLSLYQWSLAWTRMRPIESSN